MLGRPVLAHLGFEATNIKTDLVHCQSTISTQTACTIGIFVQIGFSELDQPIIYSCMAMAKDHDIYANREHMLVTFEQVQAPDHFLRITEALSFSEKLSCLALLNCSLGTPLIQCISARIFRKQHLGLLQAIRAMPPHVEQWIWLCDFHGFGLRSEQQRWK